MSRRVAPKHFTLAERLEFHSIPEPNSGCLIWTAATDGDGYGFITVNGRQTRAHRAAYELTHGAVPAGLVLDHLCRVHSCINPRHLEAVTQRVNTLRGISPIAENAEKVTCKRGHPLSGDNLMPSTRGYRVCAECRRASNLASYHRNSKALAQRLRA